MNQAYKYYKELPGLAKGVVVVGGLAVLTIVGFKAYKLISKTIDREKEKKAVDESKEELNDLENSGVRPSYQDSQYSGWADKIHNQFDGCDFDWSFVAMGSVVGIATSSVMNTLSNSGKTVYAILSNMNNDADFLSLVKAYGVRTYDQCGWFMGDFTGNLYKAVNDELSANEIKEMNTLLAKKGISYKF